MGCGIAYCQGDTGTNDVRNLLLFVNLDSYDLIPGFSVCTRSPISYHQHPIRIVVRFAQDNDCREEAASNILFMRRTEREFRRLG